MKAGVNKFEEKIQLEKGDSWQVYLCHILDKDNLEIRNRRKGEVPHSWMETGAALLLVSSKYLGVALHDNPFHIHI